ncbi:MAG: 4-hydroxy-tetrahydrodipicolinate reductase [Spirochaetia bacterium]|nr:4-hydroxy-tetrahydrodipicolinate reductase [Spirochaetia bacterium]
MIPFAMIGAAGRMGRTIIALTMSDFASELRLSGALEYPESPHVGKDAGELAGVGASGVTVTGKMAEALTGAKVAIDFSRAESVLANARACAEAGVGLVVGTTGLTESERTELTTLSKKIPMMVSPNMSVGVNALFALVAEAARRLSGYDVEIVEIHHHHKKDAPSGTAVRLKEIVRDTLGRQESDVIYGREGLVGERPRLEIGVHAVRGGDVVGDHTVYFMTNGERVELTHRASSRNAFAGGAVRAALFLAGKNPGLWSSDPA